jgi:hypothetical protein
MFLATPKLWTANTWHHVQIASHRDDDGVVTYDWVNLNGTYTDFTYATVSSAEKLGWTAGDLLLTFSWTEPVPVAGPLRPILTKRLSTDGDMANCKTVIVLITCPVDHDSRLGAAILECLPS